MLKLLRDTLESARNETAAKFVGPVAKRAKRYIAQLLPDCDLTFTEDLTLASVSRTGIDESCANLSRGTQEQLAVLTRIALTDLLLEQGKPVSLILDDPLVYSDDGRLDTMLEILTEGVNAHADHIADLPGPRVQARHGQQDKSWRRCVNLARIQDTHTAISGRHGSMLGPKLAQAVEVGLAGTDFGKLTARLSLVVDTFEIERNGLGYNNLIYMAVVLSELAKNADAAFRGLIVEEPEAHLHPQLQAVLLRYLSDIDSGTMDEKPVQVFVTSHSPRGRARSPPAILTSPGRNCSSPGAHSLSKVQPSCCS